MGTAKKVNFHGSHYQANTVIKMLTEEINHFQQRIDMIEGSELEGHLQLLKTYKEMVSVRQKIKADLEKLLDKP